jgi:hypothetical protein
MSRLLLFLVLFFAVAPPGAAQHSAELGPEWTLGTTVQATFMERAPTATGVGISVTRMRSDTWGARVAVRRDAAIQRDIGKAYRTLGTSDAEEWSDQRRLNLTAAAVWRPVHASSGEWGHTLQVHLGPTLQLQRGEQMRSLGILDRPPGSIIGEPGFQADNTYLDQTREGRTLLLLTDDANRMNVGGTLGMSYGLSYRGVSVQLGLMARKLTNIDGFTFGAGGGLALHL